MFHKVVVGLDGSRVAEAAIPWVRLVAPQARLVLVHSFEPMYFAGSPESAIPFVYLENAGEEYLSNLSRRMTPPPQTFVRHAPAGAAMVNVADEQGCDAIALVHRGEARMRRRLLGGTTEQILHHCRAPVLVIPASARELNDKTRLKRIAVPLDGSEMSQRILPLASALARYHGASLVLLHCLVELHEAEHLYSELWARVKERAPLEKLERALRKQRGRIRARFVAIARRMTRRGVPTRALVVQGRMSEAVLDAAKRARADIITMCVHGHGFMQHVIHGAIASRLIQSADIPLLVARHDCLKPANRSSGTSPC